MAHRHGHDPAVMLRDYGHLRKNAQEEMTHRFDAQRQAAMGGQTGNVIPFAGRRPKGVQGA